MPGLIITHRCCCCCCNNPATSPSLSLCFSRQRRAPYNNINKYHHYRPLVRRRRALGHYSNTYHTHTHIPPNSAIILSVPRSLHFSRREINLGGAIIESARGRVKTLLYIQRSSGMQLSRVVCDALYTRVSSHPMRGVYTGTRQRRCCINWCSLRSQPGNNWTELFRSRWHPYICSSPFRVPYICVCDYVLDQWWKMCSDISIDTIDISIVI